MDLTLPKLTICTKSGWIENLANSAELAGIEELVLEPDFNDNDTLDLHTIYEPKHLDALRVLRIKRGVTLERAKELLRSPLSRRLEVLDLSYVPQELEKALLEMGWDGLIEKT
jgi:hypothetical protein